MASRLTAQAGLELTARWHDQTLDLESLAFDEAKRECTFTVTEAKQDPAPLAKSGVQRNTLQRCRVTVKNVTRVDVVDAKGEVELYVNEVEASPTSLRLKCVNGILDLTGEAMETNLDVEDTRGATEVNLATPLGDVSWRRKHTKPES